MTTIGHRDSHAPRPEPADPRDWAAGERCLAYHPEDRRRLSLGTVTAAFTDAPKKFYVYVRFDDGQEVTTHKINVYPAPVARRAGVVTIGSTVRVLDEGTGESRTWMIVAAKAPGDTSTLRSDSPVG
jgi:hypothetical protein